MVSVVRELSRVELLVKAHLGAQNVLVARAELLVADLDPGLYLQFLYPGHLKFIISHNVPPETFFLINNIITDSMHK